MRISKLEDKKYKISKNGRTFLIKQSGEKLFVLTEFIYNKGLQTSKEVFILNFTTFRFCKDYIRNMK